jgi:hypothetical protein
MPRRLLMARIPMRLFITAAVAAGAFACGVWSGRDAGPPTAFAAAPAAPHLYELRIYTAAPGKMDALHTRFRDHTLRLFEKHGIKSVGYWTGVDDGRREKLYYLVAYPDREARERRLVDGIAKDPAFLKAVAASEEGGKLTSGTESVLLAPTDYSPMR